MSRTNLLVVVSDRRDLECEDLRVVDADTYLEGGADLTRPGLEVINLCRTWKYLSRGYYVSLLAEARGHHAIPTIPTLQAVQDAHARFRALREAGVEVVDDREMAARMRRVPTTSHPGEGTLPPPVRELDEEDVPFLRPALAEEVAEVLVCLGRCESSGFQRLANRVFRAWPAPVLRMRLLKEDGRWKLYDLVTERVQRLEGADRDLLLRALRQPRLEVGERGERRLPSIAVLYDESDPYKPSSPETIDRIERTARRRGLRMQRIGTGDVSSLDEHDALLIRVLTGLDQPSMRFATRAEALGIPVIDDPRSIIRCSNKIFLHEMLAREGLATPKTRIVGREDAFVQIAGDLGTPFILKLPDGSFSGAVFKVQDPATYAQRAGELFRRSPLLVAQEYLPTDYDWRVTVLDGKPLFVARYHMAPGHWQIRSATPSGVRYGRVESVARDAAPRDVVRLGVRAARLVGEGLYGVDIKDGPRGPVVIEVNDNPNIDTGYDDAADGDVIYEDLISYFERRIPRDRAEVRPRPRPRVGPAPDELEELRKPIGRAIRRQPGRPYKAWEVVGLEIEYPVVDRDLNVLPIVEEALSTLAGRPVSDVELGSVAFSNELFDHVLEIKTPLPLRSLERSEELLVEGVRRMGMLLAARFGARLLPTGMHPWMDPTRARLWRRSNRRIYQTYSRLFDVRTHGWANVQATHVNLPVGRDEEAVAMMNAASLLVPYLPALAASSPMYDGELQPAVDNRLGFIIEHQSRMRETCGDIVPEPCENLSQYRRDVLGRMYRAVDKLPDAEALRHEFLNARGAVFKLSRQSMEVRVLDVQECVKMDVAIAAFTRAALRALAADLMAGRLVGPDHALLVEDFRAAVAKGTRARVRAPHLAGTAHRDDAGRADVRDVLRDLLARAERKAPAADRPYLGLVADIVEHGSLSERIARHLEPYLEDDERFTDAARRIWIELSECLVENRPWAGRQS